MLLNLYWSSLVRVYNSSSYYYCLSFILVAQLLSFQFKFSDIHTLLTYLPQYLLIMQIVCHIAHGTILTLIYILMGSYYVCTEILLIKLVQLVHEIINSGFVPRFHIFLFLASKMHSKQFYRTVSRCKWPID